MREEWFKFFDLLTPYVDNEEQAAISASFSPQQSCPEQITSAELTYKLANRPSHPLADPVDRALRVTRL